MHNALTSKVFCLSTAGPARASRGPLQPRLQQDLCHESKLWLAV